MDQFYNIAISGDLNSIENDMNEWLNMPYDMRKKSNDIALMRYGMSNEELYNLMKGTISKNPDQSRVQIESAIQESLFFSKDVFEYNLTDFYNGNINICFITGFSGSGKSTLGIALKNKIRDCEYISLDAIGCMGVFPKEDFDNLPKIVKDFFTKDPVGKDYRTSTDRFKGLLYCAPAFINYIIKHKGSKTKYVVEGIAVYTGVNDGKIDINDLKPFSIIIMGTSVMQSTYRAVVRDVKHDLESGTKVDFEFVKRVFTRIKNRFGMNFQADKILDNLKKELQTSTTEASISYKDEESGESISKNSNEISKAKIAKTIKKNDISELPYELQSKIEKCRLANLIMTEDDDIVIINDFIDDTEPDYSEEYLQNKINIYYSLNDEHRLKSDQHSMRIWNKSVLDMYELIKGKLNTYRDKEKHTDSKGNLIYDNKDSNLKNYEYTITKLNRPRYQNTLEQYYRKIDCLAHNNERSIYESVVLESFADKITVKGKTYFQGAPEVTPFLTYDEYVNNPKCLDMRRLSRVDPFTYVTNYMDTTKSAYKELKDASREKDENKLLEMGWNPVVPVNAETIKFARDRQIKWLNNHYEIEHVDVTGFKPTITTLDEADINEIDLLEPVFLVFKKEETKISLININLYSKPGISFDSSMKSIYVQNNRYGRGVDIVALNDYYQDCVIVCFFVSKDIRDIMIDRMNYTFNNARNTIALRLSYFYKDLESKKGYSLDFIVSDMIDILLELSGLEKHSRVIWKIHYKYFSIFDGLAKTYNQKTIDSYILSLLHKKSFKVLNYLKESDISYHISQRTLECFEFKTDNENINQLLKEVDELLTPEAVDKNLKNETYESLLSQYEDSVKALASYGASDFESIKREILKMNYISSISFGVREGLKKSDSDYAHKFKLWDSLCMSSASMVDKYASILMNDPEMKKEFDLEYYAKTNEGLVPRKVKVDNKIYKYLSGYCNYVLNNK